MVIFDDLHKLLLYQRLNLGFECQVCKEKFLNKLDYLQHTSVCKVQEKVKCPKCGKTFGHHQILHLHMQFHNLSRFEDRQPETEHGNLSSQAELKSLEKITSDQETRTDSNSVTERDNNTLSDITKDEEDNTTQERNQQLPTIDVNKPPKKISSHRNRSRNKTGKTKIGLTKIKMEDCLRCDDCSCIYIDDKDYYKHMRNFHRLDVNNMPIVRQNSRPKRKCQSCCKQCRGINCTPVKKPRAMQSASNLIFKINMRDNIKERWTKMVSSQMNECTKRSSEIEEVQIKPDPDSVTIKMEPPDSLDLSHLLSQVEVKIKTEPADY